MAHWCIIADINGYFPGDFKLFFLKVLLVDMNGHRSVSYFFSIAAINMGGKSW